MKVNKLFACIALVALFVSLSAQEFDVPDTTGMKLYKGNTHAHSNKSVGNASPTDVALWYKNNGYRFLVLTDDSVPSAPDIFSAISDSSFIVIPGLEIKALYQGRWIHTNGLNVEETIYPKTEATLESTLQRGIDEIRKSGGVAQINHPKYRLGPEKDEILGSQRCTLVEIDNAYIGHFTLEKNGFTPMEMDWDYLLAAGKRIFGVASDDANTYPGKSGYGGTPGRGWVVVWAKSLDGAEICKNLNNGLFYASNGVELSDIQIEKKRIIIYIKQTDNVSYTTSFVGTNGKILKTTEQNPAIFDLASNTKYVRARVLDSNGKMAWIQPVFVKQ